MQHPKQERLLMLENITSAAVIEKKIEGATSTWEIQLHTVVGIYLDYCILNKILAE